MRPLPRIPFLFSIAALGVATACTPTGSPQAAPSTPAVATPTRQAAPVAAAATPVAAAASSIPFDQQFIDMMVPHHEGAVEMATIAKQRGRRPEITRMAADILRTQQAEIDQMKGWRRAWFGSDETPPLSRMPMVDGMEMPASGGHAEHGGAVGPSMTMDMQKDVDALRTVQPFDLAFVDAMIPHHQDAINASRAALQRASRQEIRDLAVSIIEAQQKEIGLMREWRLQLIGSGSTAPGVPTPVPGRGGEVPMDDHAGH